MARNALALIATIAVAAASGALNAPPFSRRTAAFGVAALTLFTPFLAAPTAPALRFLCAGGAALALFRNLDLVRDSRRWPAGERAVHVLLPFDTRRVVRSPRHFDASALLRAAAFALPTAAAVALVLHNAPATTRGAWLTRWSLGAIAAYCSLEVVIAAHHVGAGLLGFTLPKLHDHPILARTLGEFWGRRWNLSVRNMLHSHVFRPLARHTSLATAIFTTFAASALLHAWLVLAAGGFVFALSCASFFVIQGAFVLVEQRARVREWPVVLQRTWTAAGVLLPLPLLLEPLLTLALH